MAVTDSQVPAVRPRVLIVSGPGSASPLEMVEALPRQCAAVFVDTATASAASPFGRLEARLGVRVEAAGRPFGELVAAVRRERPVALVCSADDQLALAGRLARALSLAFHGPRVIERLTDKAAQVEALAAAGLRAPATVVVEPGAGRARLAGALEHLGFPLVAKPRSGHSSRQTRPLLGEGELDAFLAEPRQEDFLLQEFLVPRASAEGLASYVSVECVALAGRVHPLAVTGKFALAPPFRETGNLQPALVEGACASRVEQLAVAAAEVVGVVDGVLHTEIQLTERGPVVIEVNGRVAGGGIDELHRDRTGVSLRQLAARAALGTLASGDLPRKATAGWHYRYFLQPPTDARRVRSLAGLDRLVAEPGVQRVAVAKERGSALDWRLGSQEFVLSVGGVAASPGEARRVPALVSELVTVTYA